MTKTVLIGTESACTKISYVRGAFIGGACAENLYVEDAGAIEYLGMNLQSF